MPDKYDLRDQYGRKIGEAHSSPNLGDAAATSIVTVLVFGVFIFAAFLLKGLVSLYRHYPRPMLALTGVLVLAGIVSGLMSSLAADQQYRANAAASAAVAGNPNYYTANAQTKNVTIGAAGLFGYDNYTEASGQNSRLYFTIPMTNGDAASHQVEVRFQVHLTAAGWGTASDNPTELDFDWTETYVLDHGQTQQKVVWGPSWPHHMDTLSNARLVSATVLTIDGVTTTDPREVLAKIQVAAKFATPAMTQYGVGNRMSQARCEVEFTNHDALPHTIKASIAYTYTYTDLGDIKGDGAQFDLFNWTTRTIAGGATVSLTDSDAVVFLLQGLPDEVQSITTQGIVVTVADPGTDQTLESTRSTTYPSDGCNYKK